MEALHMLRDALRQAAIFSPCATTRMSCELALDDPSPARLDDVLEIAGCEYAGKLVDRVKAFREAAHV